jgi:phosphoadenosine phosphosulfate reductase
MREGISLVRSVLVRDFALPLSFPFPGLILFNRIAGLDRAEQVIIDGRLFGTLSFDPLSRGYSLDLTGAGASMLLNAGARHLEFAQEPGQRHLKGKTVLFSALRAVGQWATSGAEVIITSKSSAAAGKVQEKGVRIRDIAPSGISFSGIGGTMEDAVEANREALAAYENIAVHEIGSVLSDRPGLPLTVSFSGGKDSLVALELARRARPQLDLLFSNTGLEYPETVEHIRRLAREQGLRLIEKGAGNAFWDNLPRFGVPAKDYRWCCKVCKLAPMTELLQECFPKGVLTVEGRRRRESFARLRIGLVEESPFVPGQINIEPIRDWTALVVWLYIRWRRLRHNPLYDEDLERIGCWLCPATLESEFETLGRLHPELRERWVKSLSAEGKRLGLDARALSIGLWRWKGLPPKMKELARRAGLGPSAPSGELVPALHIASGVSPCLTGGFTLDASLSLPVPPHLDRVANLLGTLGDVRFSDDLGVAIVRRGGSSAKLFESGQMVVTGPRPASVRSLLRDVVGVVLRAALCSRCGICARSCPSKAIRVGEAPVVELSRCTRCGKCAGSCVLVHYADRMVAGLGGGARSP